MMVTPYTIAEAEQAHVENKHEQNGYAADWMECGTARCRGARLAFGIDLRRCPTCGGSMDGRGRWLHAPKEGKSDG